MAMEANLTVRVFNFHLMCAMLIIHRIGRLDWDGRPYYPIPLPRT